jgi:hypothetical protein
MSREARQVRREIEATDDVPASDDDGAEMPAAVPDGVGVPLVAAGVAVVAAGVAVVAAGWAGDDDIELPDDGA